MGEIRYQTEFKGIKGQCHHWNPSSGQISARLLMREGWGHGCHSRIWNVPVQQQCHVSWDSLALRNARSFFGLIGSSSLSVFSYQPLLVWALSGTKTLNYPLKVILAALWFQSWGPLMLRRLFQGYSGTMWWCWWNSEFQHTGNTYLFFLAKCIFFSN